MPIANVVNIYQAELLDIIIGCSFNILTLFVTCKYRLSDHLKQRVSN